MAGNTITSTAPAAVTEGTELARLSYWDLLARRVQACASPETLAELADIQDGRDNTAGRPS